MDNPRRFIPYIAIAAAGAAGAALALGGAYAVGSLDGTSTVTVREVTVENTAQPTTIRDARQVAHDRRDLPALGVRRRADHRHRQRQRRSLRRLGDAARARLGLRLRQGRLRHHELPRDRGRRIDQGHVLQRQEHQREARRLRPLHGHRGAEGEHELAARSRALHARRLRRRPGRRRRRRHRQPVRPRRGRSPRESSARCSARSRRRTSTRSTTSSRPMPRSTTATRVGRCSTRAAR